MWTPQRGPEVYFTVCKVIYKFFMQFLVVSAKTPHMRDRRKMETQRQRQRGRREGRDEITKLGPSHTAPALNTPQKPCTNCTSMRAHFWREHGRKRVRFLLAVSWLLKKNESSHTWMRKAEGGAFPLIGAHLQQFVKPWPCAVSHQEVKRGPRKAERAHGR